MGKKIDIAVLQDLRRKIADRRLTDGHFDVTTYQLSSLC